MADGAFDAMELELRQLPQVLAASVVPEPQHVAIHLLAAPGDVTELRRVAVEIAEGHVEGAIALDIAVASAAEMRSGTNALPRQRVQLLTVRRPARDDEIEVHLAFRGARTVGRGPAASLAGTVHATVDALQGLGARLPFQLKTVTRVGIGDDTAVLVIFSSPGQPDRLGIAQASNVEESTARATLCALNRFLDRAGTFEHSPAGTTDRLAG